MILKDTKQTTKLLLDNFVNEEGDLVIDHIDLSNFNGNVYINIKIE